MSEEWPEAGGEQRRNTPKTVARVLGLLLFGFLYWIQAPPVFLRGESVAGWVFVVVIWIAELLALSLIHI